MGVCKLNAFARSIENSFREVIRSQIIRISVVIVIIVPNIPIVC